LPEAPPQYGSYTYAQLIDALKQYIPPGKDPEQWLDDKISRDYLAMLEQRFGQMSDTELMLDLLQLGIDLGGIFDPTPVTDGANTVISVFRGRLLDAGTNAVAAAVPFIGDTLKLAKIPHYIAVLGSLTGWFAKSAGGAFLVGVVLTDIEKLLQQLQKIWNRLSPAMQEAMTDLKKAVRSAKISADDAAAKLMARWADNPNLAGKMPIPGARTTGVERAIALEVQLVKKRGAGTINWSPAEIAQIKQTGQLPPGIVGHHINDVARFPEWQGDPRNIELLRGQPANLEKHGGNFRNATTGPLIDRQALIDQAE